MTAHSLADSPLVNAQGLRQLLADPGCVVVDCRFDLARTEAGRQAYAEAHLPAARYAHLDQVLSAPITPASGRHPLPDPALLCAWLGEQGIDCSTPVVAYDDSGGVFASRLWWLLRWLGHGPVAVLDGGLRAWTAADYPLDHELPDIEPRTYRGVAGWMPLIETEDLQLSSRWQLIDVRTSARFSGAAEPIDPVAGHIPGAVNVPLQLNLRADGRFLGAEPLHDLYAALVQSHPIDDLVCYCGSGVTACHTILALELAGWPGARLYAGSWSEWIRDPRREVAVGAD